MTWLQEFVQKNKRPLQWLGLVLVLALPWLMPNPYYLHISTLAILYCILALGLNLIVGCAGLLNLGYAAFYGIGAYTTALLSVNFGFNFWLCLVCSILVAVGAGVVLGTPALRLRGDYLAIVTLGFGEIFRLVARNWDSLTNGPRGISGIPAPKIFGFVFVQPVHFYYLALGIGLFALVFQSRLNNSKVGRALVAIREDEIAAESLGINTTAYKLLAFALSSAFAGIAGCFFASWQGFVSPESFTFMESVIILSMVVLGGMGSLVGVIFGAVILVVLPEMLRQFAEMRILFLGLAMVIIMIFRPQGLLGNWRRARELKPATERIQTEEDETLSEVRDE